MDLEYKNWSLDIKEINEKGIFRGILTPYNNIDLGNDRVLSSFGNRNNGKRVPLLWQHDTKTIVGDLLLRNTANGIEVEEGKFFLEKDEDKNYLIPKAPEAYALAKRNMLKLSMGYKVYDYEYVTEGKNTIRNLKDGEILEGSVVTFPMNPKATITDVKGEGEKGDMELKEKVEALEVKLNEVTEMLKPQYEEKNVSDKIDEFKSYIDLETKAGKKLSKASKLKIKEALEMLKSMIADDEEADKEEDKYCDEPDRRRKENDEKLELKSDELEALENLYKTLKGEEK